MNNSFEAIKITVSPNKLEGLQLGYGTAKPQVPSNELFIRHT